MRNKDLYWLTALALVLLGGAIALPGQEKSAWKGTIRTENGVKVIRNPDQPFFGRLELELHEELTIGRKNSAQSSFHLISDVASDGQGNIYVADVKNRRVQKFDAQGKYLTSVGLGSVSFEQPSRVKVHAPSGNVFVRSFVSDIEIFGPLDQHLDRIHFKQVIYDFWPTGGKNVLAVLSKEDDTALRVDQALFRLGSSGELKQISRDYERCLLERDSMGGISQSDSSIEFDLYLAQVDEKTFVFGYSKEYFLNVIDSTGRVFFRIFREAPVPVYSREERIRFRGTPVPEAKPYFFHLMTDSKGRIYVQKNDNKGILNSVQEKTPREVDVFSRDGYFLYTAALPPNTCEIKDGLLYAYVVGETTGVESVRRYKISNWTTIKERIE